MPKHKSVKLPDHVVNGILNDHVPLTTVAPKRLFVVRANTNGLTSDWNVCVKFSAVLSAVLDATKGKQLTFKPFTCQLGKWLSANSFEWSISDIENSADGLRVMLRSLKALSHPPRNYGALQVLLDKIPEKPKPSTAAAAAVSDAAANDGPGSESSSDYQDSDAESEEASGAPQVAQPPPASGVSKLFLPWDTGHLPQAKAKPLEPAPVLESPLAVDDPALPALQDASPPKRTRVTTKKHVEDFSRELSLNIRNL